MAVAHVPSPMSRAVLEEALTAAQDQRRAALERSEVTTAELAAALDDLHAVVGIVRRVGGYLGSTDQLALWAARARLAAAGRLTPETLATVTPDAKSDLSGGQW